MFFGKKVTKNVWISVCLAVVGLYLLCFKDPLGGFSLWDLLLLVAAFFYGLHIIVVNHFARKANATKISCVQFFVVGLLSIPLMFSFEEPTMAGFIACKTPILYAGILTCGVAYTIQIFGQKFTSSPTVASLILSLESVFAVVGGCLILHEMMSLKEVLGCLFMITAVVLSQLNSKPKKIEPTSDDEDPIPVSK
jgi:drug/metabolite transporter (DMT)-like permease